MFSSSTVEFIEFYYGMGMGPPYAFLRSSSLVRPILSGSELD